MKNNDIISIETFLRSEAHEEGLKLVDDMKERILKSKKEPNEKKVLKKSQKKIPKTISQKSKLKNFDISFKKENLKLDTEIDVLPTTRLNSLQNISKKLKQKYSYLKKFTEKTLNYQVSESTDLAKTSFLLNFLSNIENETSIPEIYGKLATKTAQRYIDLGFQFDPLSKKCQNSCYFHTQFFKFFIKRCQENSGLKLKTFYLVIDLILDVLEKNFENYFEMNFSQIYDFEIYDGLINISSHLKEISSGSGYPKFCSELKSKVDEFIDEYCDKKGVERKGVFQTLPKDFMRFYTYFDVLLEDY